jgi:glutaredoxin
MPKHKQVTKASCEHKHAKYKALVRYGFEFSRKDLYAVREQIHTNAAKYLGRKSLRVSVWLAVIRGQEIPVVYDKNTRKVVTVLPMDCSYMKRYKRNLSLSSTERESHDGETEDCTGSESNS